MKEKTLYLVRHGKAEPGLPGHPDESRTLTREGREAVRLALIGLRRMGVRFDVVLSSPLRRALETATLLCGNTETEVRSWRDLAPGADLRSLVASLEAVRDCASVALVGHEPDMGLLLSYLLVGEETRLKVSFRAGAIAAIDVDRLPPVAPGTLRWFLTPEQLVLLGS